MQLSKCCQIRKVLDYVSGTADRNGTTIDMQGYEGCFFVLTTAAVAASSVNAIKVAQSSDDGVADAYSDLEGTSITVAADDDNQLFGIDVYKPAKRYLRCIVDKDASNAMAESVLALLYGPRELPVAGSITDEVTVESHVSPAEGTA